MAKSAQKANLHKTLNFQVMNDVVRPPPPVHFAETICELSVSTPPPYFRKMGKFVFFLNMDQKVLKIDQNG